VAPLRSSGNGLGDLVPADVLQRWDLRLSPDIATRRASCEVAHFGCERLAAPNPTPQRGSPMPAQGQRSAALGLSSVSPLASPNGAGLSSGRGAARRPTKMER